MLKKSGFSLVGQGRHGRIRALIWVRDVEKTDIGRHLDPSDRKEGQPLRAPRFSTVQFVTRRAANGLRLVHFGMGDGKGQGRNTTQVKAAHGGVNGVNCTKAGANCTVPTAEDAVIWGRIGQTAQNSR